MSTIEEAREQARKALSEDGFFNREQSTIVSALLDATEPSTKQDAAEAALAPYVDEIAQKVVDGLKARQGGREANQQEISNLIGILAAPFVATSTNTAANKRLKELMGL